MGSVLSALGNMAAARTGTNAAYIFSVINIIVAATATTPTAHPMGSMSGASMSTNGSATSAAPMSSFEVASLLIAFVLMGKWLEVMRTAQARSLTYVS